jgi:hypothetical protein
MKILLFRMKILLFRMKILLFRMKILPFQDENPSFHFPENQCPRKTNSHPRKTNSHPRKTNSHPRKTNSHPRKTNSHPRYAFFFCNQFHPERISIKNSGIGRIRGSYGIERSTKYLMLMAFYGGFGISNFIFKNKFYPFFRMKFIFSG